MLSPRYRGKSPSPRPRASSRDRAVDPVLAKYHAIKRELEANESRRGTPTRHVDATATPRTGRSAILRSPAPSKPVGPQPTMSEWSAAAHPNADAEADELRAQLRTTRAQLMALQRQAKSEGDAEEQVAALKERCRVLEQSAGSAGDRAHAAEHATRELRETLEVESAKRRSAENEVANMQRRLSELTMERDHLQENLRSSDKDQHSLSAAEQVLRQQIRSLEKSADETKAASREAELAFRDELRQKQKEIHDRDVKLVTMEERATELDVRRQKAAAAEEDALNRLMTLEKAFRESNTKNEALTSEIARSQILQSEADSEHRRTLDLLDDVRDELQRQIAANEASESTIQTLRKECSVRDALEQQVSAQQATIKRMDEEMAELRSKLQRGDHERAELREQLAEFNDMIKKVAEAEARAAARDLTIEKLRDDIQTKANDCDTLRTRISEMNVQVLAADERTAEKQRRMDDLEAEVHRLESDVDILNEVHGKLSALNDALEDRSATVNSLQVELHAWQSKCNGLQGDVELLSRLRAASEELEQENDRLSATVTALEEKTSLQHKRAAEQDETLAVCQAELSRKRDALHALEVEAASLLSQVAEKDQLEARLRQSQSATQSRAEELAIERERCANLQRILSEKETQANDERVRRIDLESQVQEMTQRISDGQAQLGELTVTLEGSERERQRLERELSHKTELADQRAREAERLDASLRDTEGSRNALQRQLLEVQASAEAAKTKSETLADQLASTREQYQSLQSENHEARREMDALRASLASAERHAQGERKALEHAARLTDEVNALSEALTTARADCDSLRAEVTTLEKFQTRCVDVEAQLDKARTLVESYESDNTTASRRMIEKEREIGRLRERLASATSDLQDSESKRRSVEQRLHECEADRERLKKVDGQLSGLTVVAQQRGKDLDAARDQVNELRSKLRDCERQALQRGSESAQLLVRDLEAKLSARDELVRRLEQESQSRDHTVASLRDEVARGQSMLMQSSAECERLRAENTALESARVRALADKEAVSLQGRAEVSALTTRLQDDVAHLRLENSRLQAEGDQLRHQVQTYSARREPSARRSSSVTAIESELRRTQTALEAVSSEKRAQEEMLRQQDAQLEAAADNISTLEETLQKSSAATWRERRHELAQLDAERAREYTAAAQSSHDSLRL